VQAANRNNFKHTHTPTLKPQTLNPKRQLLPFLRFASTSVLMKLFLPILQSLSSQVTGWNFIRVQHEA
jgi:hypothetical protein